MFEIPLYPDGTKSGEVVTYNGEGGVDHRDRLYIDNVGDVTKPTVSFYVQGFDDTPAKSHELEPLLRMELDYQTLDHFIRWQGDANNAGGAPVLYLKPLIPDTQDDGIAHVVIIAEQASGSGEATSMLDLDRAGTELLRLQNDTKNIGLRRSGDNFILELQWEDDADASHEHIVELFQNRNTDYISTAVDDKHEFRVFGATRLKGNTWIGQDEQDEQYMLPDARPVSLYRFPLWDGDDATLRWYKITAGSNATVTPNKTTQEIVIACTGGGGPSTGIDTDVVKSVEFDASTKKLVVTYTQLTVQAEGSSGTLPVSIGTTIEAVVDSQVGTITLQNQKRTLYVLDADGPGLYETWAQGTNCPT